MTLQSAPEQNWSLELLQRQAERANVDGILGSSRLIPSGYETNMVGGGVGWTVVLIAVAKSLKSQEISELKYS